MSVVEALVTWANPSREAGDRPDGRRSHLRPVDQAPARSRRVPFVAVLGLVLVAGLAGMLVLNTNIQSQAKQLNVLQAQANALGYQQSELTSEVQQLRSASSLEVKAYELGLRPNPYPAFITLSNGKIVGDPRPVTGKEMPDQKWSSWQQQQQAQENARAKVAAEAKARAEAEKKRLAAQKKQAEEKRKADEAKKKAEAAKKAAEAKKKAEAAKKQQPEATKKPAATKKPGDR